MPVRDEGDLVEAISSLRSTHSYVVNFDFIAPRRLHKRVIRFDARKELGVISWGGRNEVTGLYPNCLATKARIRIGWVLLAINGEPIPGGVSPASLLAELRQRANDRTDPFSHTVTAHHSELTFNTISDDLRDVVLDTQNPGVDWKVVPQIVKKGSTTPNGDIIVEKVTDAKQLPKRGWRIVKIHGSENKRVPQSREAVFAAFKVAVKNGQKEIKMTFDCSDEEPDLHGALEARGDDAIAETQVDPRDLPELPVVEPSVYLHIVGGCDFQLGGRAPYVLHGVFLRRSRTLSIVSLTT